MGARRKQFTIYDPVYDSEIFVTIGGSCEKAYQEYCSKLKIKPEADNVGIDPAGMAFCDRKHKASGMWIDDPKCIPVIVHEVIHVASHILQLSGIDIRESDNEPLCYYSQFLTREILARLKK